MATKTIIMGAFYKHDVSGKVMRLEKASSEDSDDFIYLIDPTSFTKQNCFIPDSWRGRCQQFQDQWSEVETKMVSLDRYSPSSAEINNACLSFRHDFGLMDKDSQTSLVLEARYWLEAWSKSLPGFYRKEAHEQEDESKN